MSTLRILVGGDHEVVRPTKSSAVAAAILRHEHSPAEQRSQEVKAGFE